MKPAGTRKRRLTVNRHQVLILALGAVMVGSFVMFVLRPRHHELSRLGTALRQERELVGRKVLTSRTGQYMAAQMPRMREVRRRAAERLPAEPRLAEFLQAVAVRIEAEPLSAHDVERIEGRAEGPVPAVPIRVRLLGPFPTVHRCLAAIERQPRVCRVRHLRVSRTGGGEVEAEAEILVYYLPSVRKEPVSRDGPVPNGPEVAKG